MGVFNSKLTIVALAFLIFGPQVSEASECSAGIPDERCIVVNGGAGGWGNGEGGGGGGSPGGGGNPEESPELYEVPPGIEGPIEDYTLTQQQQQTLATARQHMAIARQNLNGAIASFNNRQFTTAIALATAARTSYLAAIASYEAFFQQGGPQSTYLQEYNSAKTGALASNNVINDSLNAMAMGG